MDYFAPTDLNEALALLAKHDLAVLAGGTDFYPALGDRPLKRSVLDVTRIAPLKGIHTQGPQIKIGANTTWSELIKADLPSCFDGLKAAAKDVGSRQIQNTGTLVGNICNASPAADGCPPLLTLNASVELQSASGTREIALGDFLQGVRATALSEGELVTAITIPKLADHTNSAFEKLGSRKYLVISITMVAVVLACDESARIELARVAVGACSPVAKRLGGLEAELIGQRPERITIDPKHLDTLCPIDDVRGSASYRREAVAEQCLRAIRRAGGVDV